MSTPVRTIRIATRESQLALWQAHYVAQRLREIAPDCGVELIPVSTIGDRDRTEPLANMGGMGVFTREVQRVVLDDLADLAVHSLKDLPTDTVPGLTLAGVPERAPRFDALLLPQQACGTLDDLPAGARIGTGSLRRQAQLLHVRPDLKMLNIRGNVETRIRKLEDGEYDAIILAEAGLRRLEMSACISNVLQPPLMFPAVGQAALGIECRADDELVIELLQRLSDNVTKAEVLAERGCLRTLRAGCHAPVGVLASVQEDQLSLTGVVLSPDGEQRFEETVVDHQTRAEDIGERVAQQLISAGASAVLH